MKRAEFHRNNFSVNHFVEGGECYLKGVIDLTLPPLPEDEYPLPVRSICLNLFRNTLYRLPPLFAEDGRGLRAANNSKWQPQKTRH